MNHWTILVANYHHQRLNTLTVSLIEHFVPRRGPFLQAAAVSRHTGRLGNPKENLGDRYALETGGPSAGVM
jgi:hypothetical protein